MFDKNFVKLVIMSADVCLLSKGFLGGPLMFLITLIKELKDVFPVFNIILRRKLKFAWWNLAKQVWPYKVYPFRMIGLIFNKNTINSINIP